MRKVLLALGTLMVLFSLYFLSLLPDHMQAVVQAEKELPDIREETVAVHAVAPATVLTADNGQSLDADLYAVNERYAELYPPLLLSGRFLYQEEAQKGEDVCVLSASAALALFKADDASDHTITLGDRTLRVVGVVRDTRETDIQGSPRVYMPFRGATAAFETIVRSDTRFDQTPQGTIYSLKKEKMRAALPARLLFCGAAICLLFALGKRLKGLALRKKAAFSEALQSRYPRELLPRALPVFALIGLAAGALLFALYLLMTFLVEPAYLFPEWVPENLAELSSIWETYQKNVRLNSGAILLRTRESAAAGHFGRLIWLGCIMVLLSRKKGGSSCKKSVTK